MPGSRGLRMAAAVDGKDGLLEKLAAFGRHVDNSSLYILLAIDSTISALQEVDQIARALALSGENINHEICTNPVLAGCLLDSSGEAADGLLSGRQRIEDLLPGLIAQNLALAKLEAADHSQRDLLSFAFERCIESFAWVIDAVKKLRQAIVAHDQTHESGLSEKIEAHSAFADSLRSDAA